MADPGFASFLRRSLEALERELPDVGQRLAACLESLAVSVQVDDETMVVRSDGRRVSCDEAGGAAAVAVRTGRSTLLALIDGGTTLTDAVLSDGVLLRGDPADLVRFHDALWLYMQGAVRAPSMPDLLRAFRAS